MVLHTMFVHLVGHSKGIDYLSIRIYLASVCDWCRVT
jgi:hypothetical protein